MIMSVKKRIDLYDHLSCTLISENQDLEKLRSVSNLRKNSGDKLKKKLRSTEKKFRCTGPEIFLSFETDCNFSRP